MGSLVTCCKGNVKHEMFLTEMGVGALLLFFSSLGVFQKGKQKVIKSCVIQTFLQVCVISVEPKVKLGLVF